MAAYTSSRGFSIPTIPAGLRALAQWIVWRYDADGKKRPVHAKTGRYIGYPQPAEWIGYEEAVNAAHKHGHDGVGFVLTPEDPWTVVDLDDVIDPETGEVSPWAVSVVNSADSYTELSPSGTGLHIIVKAKLGFKKKGKPPVEIFSQGGYITFTGRVFHDAPTRDAQGWLEDLHREHHAPKLEPGTTNVYSLRRLAMTDDEVLKKARSCLKTGPRVSELYDHGSSVPVGERSEADYFFCSRLAFWTGGEAEQVKRLFRSSDLAHGKYAEKGRQGEDYLDRTVRRAIDDCKSLARTCSLVVRMGASSSRSTRAAIPMR